MKRCGRCEEVKPIEAFPIKNAKLGRRHAACKPCVQAYWREYYHRSPKLIARQRERVREYRARNRIHVYDYLRTQSCVDCGISDIVVLEFDHVVGKKRASVSAMIRTGVPTSALDAEIAKCAVRCANCHRRRTAESWPTRPSSRKSRGEQGFSPLLV